MKSVSLVMLLVSGFAVIGNAQTDSLAYPPIDTIHALELNDVTAKANKYDKPRLLRSGAALGQIELDPKQMMKLPNLGEADIFRSLKLMPGVSGTNEASSGLMVRGGTADQNLVLLDGIPIYNVDHFFGFFSAFNARAVDSVRLFKSGFDAEYGGRTSSLIQVVSVGTVPDSNEAGDGKIHGGAGGGMISANAGLEIPLGKKAMLMVAGRRSYTDVLKSPLYQNIFNLSSGSEGSTASPNANANAGGPPGGNANANSTTTLNASPSFYFYDLNARLQWDFSQRDQVSATFYRGLDDLDNSRSSLTTDSIFQRGGRGGQPGGGGNGPTRVAQTRTENIPVDRSRWGNLGVGTQWQHHWTSKVTSQGGYTVSQYLEQKDLSDTSTISNPQFTRGSKLSQHQRNEVWDYSGHFNLNWHPTEKLSFDAGVDGTVNDISYVNHRNDTVTVEDRVETGTRYGGYAQANLGLPWGLKLMPGVRGTYYEPTKESYWDPRIAGEVKLPLQLKAKVAWGRYHQFANRVTREDILKGNDYFWMVGGNTQVPVGEATHYVAGLDWKHLGTTLSLEAYRKELDGLVEFSERTQRNQLGGGGIGGGGGPGGGRPQQGIVLANGNPNRVIDSYYQGTGVSRGLEFLGEEQIGNFTGWASYTLSEVLYQFPDLNQGIQFNADQDQTHEAKVATTYTLGPVDFGLTWVFATGHPYTAPIGEYDIVTLSGDTITFNHVSDKNVLRLPSYHRLDGSVTYSHHWGATRKLQLGLSVFNLYNRENIWYRQFTIDNGQYVTTDVRLLGITPNLFVNVEF